MTSPGVPGGSPSLEPLPKWLERTRGCSREARGAARRMTHTRKGLGLWAKPLISPFPRMTQKRLLLLNSQQIFTADHGSAVSYIGMLSKTLTSSMLQALEGVIKFGSMA